MCQREMLKIRNTKKNRTMKKILISILLGIFSFQSNCNAGNPTKTGSNVNSVTGTVIVLTNAEFKQKVFDYEVNKEWKYEGKLPAIIDFYATWCGPCKQLSPRVEEIAKKFAGKVIVYKVDTDKEQMLSQSLGITSLPTLLFIPVTGQPQATMGALPTETIEMNIHEVLLVK
jgi:thioredoxin 1